MSYKTVWIDHKHVYLFEYNSNTLIKDKYLEKKEEEDTGQEISEGHQREHLLIFFKGIVEEIGNTEQLLLLGPGTAKNEFMHYCENHHLNLAKKIVGVQTMKSNPRRSEVMKASKLFYDQYFGIHNKFV